MNVSEEFLGREWMLALDERNHLEPSDDRPVLSEDVFDALFRETLELSHALRHFSDDILL
jgi:hypothetical protein